jgi:hypothetical protein
VQKEKEERKGREGAEAGGVSIAGDDRRLFATVGVRPNFDALRKELQKILLKGRVNVIKIKGSSLCKNIFAQDRLQQSTRILLLRMCSNKPALMCTHKEKSNQPCLRQAQPIPDTEVLYMNQPGPSSVRVSHQT